MGIAEKIHLSRGDLTQAKVDAIVNAANNDLQLGGGVAGAIRIKGGPSIQQECDAIGSIPIGGAAITGGGNLSAPYVIHAASMHLGGATTAKALRGSTAHALRIAHEKAMKSIAFPAVGTGIAGFPLRECAEIMLDEVVRHLKDGSSLEQVHFVLYDQAALDVFAAVWDEMKSQGKVDRVGARILFLCTGNRARSQMAEGLARALAGPGVEVASAGTKPNPKGIHPLAIEMLRERDIDASSHRPKHLGDLQGEFDYVITLCDSAAQECPSYPARRARLHWGLPDPDLAGGDPVKERVMFTEIRDEIERRLRQWMSREGLAKKP